MLSDLVVKGIKTATSSGFVFYELENELLPKVGEYNIILDSKGEAVCIIKTIKVEVVPFCCISKEHAYKEGEGTKTLEYWRISHKDFFSKELFKFGLDFDENMKVVTEEFELVYTALPISIAGDSRS